MPHPSLATPASKLLNKKRSEMGGIVDMEAAHGSINPDFHVGAFIEECILCRRSYEGQDLDQDPLCPECEKKTPAEQEAIWRDNMFGQGVRLQDRAWVPRKIAGTWSGGPPENPINTARGAAAYKAANKYWRDEYNLPSPWARRQELLRKINADNPDTQ